MPEVVIIVGKATKAIDSQYSAKAPDGTFGLGCTIAEALHQLAFMIEFRDIEPDPPKITLDDELLAKVTRYEELKPFVREKEAIKKLIKPSFEGEKLVEIGPFDVTGSWVDNKGYTVKPYTYWNWGIKPNLKRLGIFSK